MVSYHGGEGGEEAPLVLLLLGLVLPDEEQTEGWTFRFMSCDSITPIRCFSLKHGTKSAAWTTRSRAERFGEIV